MMQIQSTINSVEENIKMMIIRDLKGHRHEIDQHSFAPKRIEGGQYGINSMR
jgi:hypothetical protein